MWASSASRLCECWLPEERPAPNWVRTVSAICGRAAGHEGHLGRLVEQLVEADADEVEVHQLDHRVHAGHGRADADAHDRRLGDRRVADAIAEAVVQAAHQPEHVAAGADVDAGDEHPLVAGRARPRGRRGSRPWCGRSARPSARLGGSGSCGRGRTTKSCRPSALGRASSRAARRRRRAPAATEASSASMHVVGDRRPIAEPRCVHEQRVALLPLAQLVGATGSAAGRPRSGRASGRSRPRRRSDRARRAPPRPPRPSATAVATTSLPSTAT